LNFNNGRKKMAVSSPFAIMELKVQCDCGQKFKFDVEPVNNEVPFAVNCPVCGADGTGKANGLLRMQPAAPALVPAVATAAAPAQLRISASAPPVATAPPPPRMPATAAARPGIAGARVAAKDSSGPTNLGLGALGALIGAGVGSGLMYGFFKLTDLRFPLMGTGVGVLTGLGARILFRGTDSALGAISGGVAAVAVIGTLYFMYGEFPIMSIISVLVSISFAYKLAS
jgi:hypothetical protein